MREDEVIVFCSILFLILAFFLVYIMGQIFGHREKMLEIRCRASSENADIQRSLNELSQRLEKVEQRVANVETIVLEVEKQRQFERAL